MARKWIQAAIKHPGAFAEKAKKAGLSVARYAAKVSLNSSRASTTTKRQAALARTLAKVRPRKK